MNITPVFLEAKIYGTFDVIHNQSEGLIKLFHHKKIDLALNPMRLSMDRSYVVDIVVIGSDEVKGSTLRNISMMNPPKVVIQDSKYDTKSSYLGRSKKNCPTENPIESLHEGIFFQILIPYSNLQNCEEEI